MGLRATTYLKMFGIRTPIAGKKSPTKSPINPRPVRRSIEEWEASKDATSQNKARGDIEAGPSKVEAPEKVASKTATQPKQTTPTGTAQAGPPSPQTFASRTAEARAKLLKAKYQLNALKSMKKEVKVVVVEVLDRLYELVKESEAATVVKPGKPTKTRPGKPDSDAKPAEINSLEAAQNDKMLSKLEEHSRLLLETNQKLNELNSNMELHREALSRAHQPTYAGVTAGSREKLQPSTLHSVVVTSTDELETGEETLDRVRKAVDAKEGWIRVERIRKAKDRKIIMGFATIEEREKARQRIIEKENGLTVEEVQNKDPLVILKDILAVNTDEDVLKALKNQNRSIFQDL